MGNKRLFKDMLDELDDNLADIKHKEANSIKLEEVKNFI